ncbi:hypothetical protein DPX16_19362 [Anabarilius grahami]|uniref:Uncharacterized protein n=1 Tax=Anabarilius grahami TaxID=495550 RepID=A0A3N0Z0V0_ANAGA|nr:hypothetical protein DPX16_19362 [Anabarilius grahami]
MDRKEPLVEPSARGPFLNALSRQLQPAEKRVPNTQQLAYTSQRSARRRMTMTFVFDVIVIRSLSPAPGKLRENKTFSNFPTSSSTSPVIAATVMPQHKRGQNHQAEMQTALPSGRVPNENRVNNRQTHSSALKHCVCVLLSRQKNAQKNMYIQCQTLGHG